MDKARKKGSIFDSAAVFWIAFLAWITRNLSEVDLKSKGDES